MADGWEDAPGQWEDAGRSRTPPTKLKIGREGFGDAMRAVLEEHPVAGRAAAFGSFPRQVYEGVKQALGREDKEAITGTRQMEEVYPGSAAAGGLATVGLASLVPGGGTVLGQTALGTALGAAMPSDDAVSRAGSAGLGLLGGLGGSIALKGLGKLGSMIFSRSAAKAGEKGAENVVRDATLAEGRKAGYVIPRSVTGEGGAGTKAVESIGGKAALGQEASIRNQTVTNRLAAKEAGLRPNEPLTDQALEAARERLAKPYRDIAAMSPRAAKALEDMKAARAEAKLYHREYGSTQRVAALKKAERLDAKAEGAERTIAEEALKLAQGQGAAAKATIKALRDARTAIAKNYQVEKALNPGNGNVDAHVIGRELKKRGTRAMTGGLQTIGKMAQAFPKFTSARPPQDVAPGIGQLKPYAASLALGIGAEQGHERLGLSPYMMGAAALPLLGGPARSIALSRLMQGAPEYAPGMSARAANYLTNDPRLRAMIPLSGVAGILNANRQGE